MNNHSLLLPGDSFEFQELPINHNKNATSVVLPELPNLSVFVHAYKNDPRTFRNWTYVAGDFSCLDLDQDDQYVDFTNTYQQLPPLLVNGFAGSQMASDAVAPRAQTLKIEEPTILAGFPQKFSKCSECNF